MATLNEVATVNLIFAQGEDVTVPLEITDKVGGAVDITGNTYTAKIRPTYDSATVTATFSGAVNDATAGLYDLTLADTVTELIDPGSYVWDVWETTSGGADQRLFKGAVTVEEPATR